MFQRAVTVAQAALRIGTVHIHFLASRRRTSQGDGDRPELAQPGEQDRAANELLARLQAVMERNGVTPKAVYEQLAAGQELEQPLSRKTALRRRLLDRWCATENSDTHVVTPR